MKFILFFLFTVTPNSGFAKSLTAEVLENQATTVTAEDIIFLGHATSFWDGNFKTQTPTRRVLESGISRDYYTIATAARHMIEDPLEAAKHYFEDSEIDLLVESRAGQHRLNFTNLKNIFFVGGNLNRCLCEGIRDVAIGFSESQKFETVNMYLVKDAIYTAYNPFSPIKEEAVALEFVSRFFVPAFNCPLQNWGRATQRRKEMPEVAMSVFYDGKHLKDYDLEPTDPTPLKKLKKKINVHFINSNDVEAYLKPLSNSNAR